MSSIAFPTNSGGTIPSMSEFNELVEYANSLRTQVDDLASRLAALEGGAIPTMQDGLRAAIAGVSANGQVLSFTKGDGSVVRVTTQDRDTTYSAGNGLSLSSGKFATTGAYLSGETAFRSDLEVLSMKGRFVASVPMSNGNCFNTVMFFAYLNTNTLVVDTKAGLFTSWPVAQLTQYTTNIDKTGSFAVCDGTGTNSKGGYWVSFTSRCEGKDESGSDGERRYFCTMTGVGKNVSSLGNPVVNVSGTSTYW